MGNLAIKNPSRRKFLRTAPVAAAAGLALTDASMFTARATGQTAAAAPGKFQLITAKSIQDDIKTLQANPGNNNLVTEKEFLVILTTETGKSAKEFEWHEHRDHVLQILDGTTLYEVGGTPKDGRSIRPGEWLAPMSEGSKALTLKKGDMLIIPRGTPHKRSTAGTVTLTLISPQGNV